MIFSYGERDPSDGLNTYKLAILPGDGAGNFGSPSLITVGKNARDFFNFAVGDLNNDGKLDMVVIKETGDAITVLFGNGNNGVAARLDFPAGPASSAPQIADITGDGKLDVLTIGRDSKIYILPGTGDGSFGAPVGYSPNNVPTRVAIGDLNGDNKPDLVATSFTFSDPTISILLNNGSGGFGTPTKVTVGASESFPNSPVIADFNADGKKDIALAAGFNLVTLTGNGNGTFAAPVNMRLANAPTELKSGDFNEDGKADLVMFSSDYPRSLSLMIGNGTGGFNPPMLFNAGGSPTSFDLADVNSDGKLDVCIASLYAEAYTLLLGKVAGGFDFKGTNFGMNATARLPRDFVVSDFNADGKRDIMVSRDLIGSFNQLAQGPLALLFGDGAGLLGAPIDLRHSTFQSTALAQGDFNGDGKTDIAAGTDRSSLMVFRGDGNGGLLTPTEYPAGLRPANLIATDLNGDGKTDLISANLGDINANNSGSVSVLLNFGPGFSEAVNYPAGAYPNDIVVADFNADNRPDIAVTNSAAVAILINNGSGAFAAPVTLNVGSFPGGMTSGDFNGDGKADLTVISEGGLKLSVFPGNGTGGFGTPALLTLSKRIGGNIQAADFNLDGKLDLAAADSGSPGGSIQSPPDFGSIILFSGNGNGTFASSISFRASVNPRRIRVDDFNNDGKPDIIALNQNANDLTVLLNTTNCTANTAPSITTASALTRQAGSAAGNAVTIATVNDAQTAAGSLTVAATTVPAGLSITNITNNNGTISANLAAGCTAAVGANIVTLTVSDGAATTTANLSINVTANTPPQLGTYPATTMNAGTTTTVMPAVPPSDNGTIGSITATAGASFTGTLSVNATTGVVTATNAAPAGTYPVTVTATDNCNAMVTQGLTLTVSSVNTAPTITAGAALARQQGSAGATLTLATISDAQTAASSLTVTATTVPNGLSLTNLTNSNGTITATAPGTFGPFTVNPTTGVVTHAQVSNAGDKIVTVTATDNCQMTTTTTFPLTINKLRTQAAISAPLTLSGANAAGEEFRFRVEMNTLEGTPMVPPTASYEVLENGVKVDGFTIFPGATTSVVEFRSTTIRPGRHTFTTRYLGDGDRLPSPLSAPVTFYVNYALANASAANYRRDTFAPEQIIAAFGTNLATATQAANTIPLPTTLAGTTVKISDGSNEWMAPLFFVSPGQVNYLIPAGIAAARVVVTITNGDFISAETVTLATLSPGLFTVNASGQGLAAAQVLRVLANGTQRYEEIARFDATANQWVAIPIDLSNANEQAFLILYGTGIRGRTSLSAVTANAGGTNAEALYAGPQGLSGLDQINLRLPRGLAGRGDVDVALTVDGKTANPVRVNVR